MLAKMSSSHQLMVAGLALLHVSVFPAAMAADVPAPGKYVGLLGLGYFPDSALDLDNGAGARGLFGLPVAPNLNIEFSAFGYGADPEDDTLPYLKQYGAGMDLMAPLARGGFTPFLLVGGGYNRAEARGAGEFDNGYANAGLGALIDLGKGFALRAEGRYVAFFPDSSADLDEGHYDDAVAGLGVQYTFQTPAPAAVLPPPPPVPAPAPAIAAPMDSDGDGVVDSADRCPGTPRGTAVDARGCPADADGDGVPNEIDQCPDTPPGLRVDATGCVRTAQTVVLQGVNFEFNKDTLTADSRVVLSRVAKGLLSQKDLRVEIAGHTDSVGSDAYNERLSDRRAGSVKTFLIGQGVSPAQLVSRGYGESQPVSTNDTDDGRAKNRRVEFRVLSKK